MRGKVFFPARSQIRSGRLVLNLAFFLFFLFVSKGFFFLFTDGRLSRFSWRRTGGKGRGDTTATAGPLRKSESRAPEKLIAILLPSPPPLFFRSRSCPSSSSPSPLSDLPRNFFSFYLSLSRCLLRSAFSLLSFDCPFHSVSVIHFFLPSFFPQGDL